MPRVFQDPDFQNLASTGLLLSNYYALSHPSQPNYIASVGGDYFGLDSDDVVNIPKNVSTVVDVFDTKGITWKEYLEDIPRPGFQGASSPNGLYARKHKYSAPIFATNTIHANVCPSSSLISYDSISSNASRLSNIVGFEAFIHDLNQHTLPQFSIVAPNLLNDAHDTTISYAANWTLKFLIPSLRKNSYFDNRTSVPCLKVYPVGLARLLRLARDHAANRCPPRVPMTGECPDGPRDSRRHPGRRRRHRPDRPAYAAAARALGRRAVAEAGEPATGRLVQAARRDPRGRPARRRRRGPGAW